MSKTLKIKNIDFELLERQRLCLSNVAHALEESDFTSEKEDELLQGLLCMLDHWSDERYFAKKNSKLKREK